MSSNYFVPLSQKILIAKNIMREGPGLLEGVLKNKGIDYDIADLQAGDTFPSPRGYDGLVVLGGQDSANDQTDKMRDELIRVREALDHHLPYLGVCLGMQVLVKAAGGNIVKAAQPETGFLDPDGEQYCVDITDAGQDDPLLAGLPAKLPVFHLHGETVEL